MEIFAQLKISSESLKEENTFLFSFVKFKNRKHTFQSSNSSIILHFSSLETINIEFKELYKSSRIGTLSK